MVIRPDALILMGDWSVPWHVILTVENPGACLVVGRADHGDLDVNSEKGKNSPAGPFQALTRGG